jgi:hypothetical protein
LDLPLAPTGDGPIGPWRPIYPVVTIIGLQLGAVIAFAIITESVFQWPGLGAMFVQAVQFVDIPVMAAYLLFVGLVFVATNLLVDLSMSCSTPAAWRRDNNKVREASELVPSSQRFRARLRRFDLDLAYSFRSSPVAIIAGCMRLLAGSC